MIYKFRIGKYRITFTFAPVTDIIGVNSNLDGDDHILMWDFDETQFYDVTESLLAVQRVYELPQIYILETKKPHLKLGELHKVGSGSSWQTMTWPGNYMAYCFKRTPWRKVVEIIACTKGVDWNYLKYGMYRNHFTLRVTPKCGRNIKLTHILTSSVPEDCSVPELMSWVKYETLADKVIQ